MVSSGFLPEAYKELFAAGELFSIKHGVHRNLAVAMPLIAEFSGRAKLKTAYWRRSAWVDCDREGDRRMLGFGCRAGVIPMAWLVLGRGVQISLGSPARLP